MRRVRTLNQTAAIVAPFQKDPQVSIPLTGRVPENNILIRLVDGFFYAAIIAALVFIIYFRRSR
jgi:hypothetical protein